MLRTAALLGAAVLAAAGLAGASAAEPARTHVLTVRLPDGSIEQIRYLGDQIRFDQAPLFSPGFEAVGEDSPFVALARMSAEMDREGDVERDGPLAEFRLWVPRYLRDGRSGESWRRARAASLSSRPFPAATSAPAASKFTLRPKAAGQGS